MEFILESETKHKNENYLLENFLLCQKNEEIPEEIKGDN
jgi:hypothetical protein